MEASVGFVTGGLLLLWAVRNRTGGNTNETDGRKVVLVGAGPGAVDLISVRGMNRIATGDFILYDRLVAPELLKLVKPGAVLINVGKSPTKKRFPQSEINELLVQLGTNKHPDYNVGPNASIVRVKGGDPFIFGLGGEEILALAKVNVPCEVVPGISSATAVPGIMGIPVTQKGVVTSFTVVSGHIPPGEPKAADWESFSPTSTLVVMMGVKSLPLICDFLFKKRNWDKSKAVAVIESGTTKQEKVVRGTLETITSLAESKKVKSPAIIVIGDVVNVLDPQFILAAVTPGGGEHVWGAARQDIS